MSLTRLEHDHDVLCYLDRHLAHQIFVLRSCMCAALWSKWSAKLCLCRCADGRELTGCHGQFPDAAKGRQTALHQHN